MKIVIEGLGGLSDFEGESLAELLKQAGAPPEIVNAGKKLDEAQGAYQEGIKRHRKRLQAKIDHMQDKGFAASFTHEGFTFAWKGEGKQDLEVQLFLLSVLMWMHTKTLVRGLAEVGVGEFEQTVLLHSLTGHARQVAEALDKGDK